MFLVSFVNLKCNANKGYLYMFKDKELDKIKADMLKRIIQPADKGLWIDGQVLTLSTKNFEDISKSAKPVIVDFWAGWCRPCMAMKPVFEAMAVEYSGKIHFASVNVDQNQPIAQRYGITSIPNFCIFKNGQLVDRVIGGVGKTGLQKVLNRYV